MIEEPKVKVLPSKPKRVIPPPVLTLTLDQAMAFVHKHYGESLAKLAK